MNWRRRLKNFWNNGGERRAFYQALLANVLTAPIFPVLQSYFPQSWSALHLPDWSIVLFIEFLIIFTLGLLVRDRSRSTSVSTITDASPLISGEDAAGAYIMLKVKPGTSEDLARHLSKMSEVKCAAAVWGQWDVIARIHVGTAASFVELLNRIQRDKNVRRTETQLTRTEQPFKPPAYPPPDRQYDLAFLLLKVDARDTQELLEAIERKAAEPGSLRVEHGAGILGTYDVALTVRYSSDKQLASFVMDFSQGEWGAETVTMPAVRGMTFARGVPC
jgi:Lrp/AsnC ligand binding domain